MGCGGWGWTGAGEGGQGLSSQEWGSTERQTMEYKIRKSEIINRRRS